MFEPATVIDRGSDLVLSSNREAFTIVPGLDFEAGLFTRVQESALYTEGS